MTNPKPIEKMPSLEALLEADYWSMRAQEESEYLSQQDSLEVESE